MGELLTAFGQHGLSGLILLVFSAGGWWLLKMSSSEREKLDNRHREERKEFQKERESNFTRNEAIFEKLSVSLDGISKAVHISNEINKRR